MSSHVLDKVKTRVFILVTESEGLLLELYRKLNLCSISISLNNYEHPSLLIFSQIRRTDLLV